jgi:biopolymer transport protein ExbD
MIDIERQLRKAKSIPLISLIDVVFQLLIYLMLSTSFTRAESLELSLPSNANTVKLAANPEDAQTVHIYISDNGETFLENQSIGEKDIPEQLKPLLALDAHRGILILSASKVSVELLVRVMDRIYTAGGKNIAVADWIMPVKPAVTPAVAPVAPANPSQSTTPEGKSNG